VDREPPIDKVSSGANVRVPALWLTQSSGSLVIVRLPLWGVSASADPVVPILNAANAIRPIKYLRIMVVPRHPNAASEPTL
jgi:hypothetical protein